MRVSQDEDYRAEWIYTTQVQPVQSLARGPCPCHGHQKMAVPSHQILLDLATSPSNPYREKDAAQAAGARWDRKERSCFYTADMDSPGFDQWKVREPEAGRRAPFALVAPFNQIFDVAGPRVATGTSSGHSFNSSLFCSNGARRCGWCLTRNTFGLSRPQSWRNWLRLPIRIPGSLASARSPGTGPRTGADLGGGNPERSERLRAAGGRLLHVWGNPCHLPEITTPPADHQGSVRTIVGKRRRKRAGLGTRAWLTR